MRVIALKTLREFWKKHPDSEEALTEWYATVERAKWRSTHDIKATFRSADFVANNRVVFDIRSNKYRLIAVVLLGPAQQVWIRFVGTHAAYDKVDATKV